MPKWKQLALNLIREQRGSFRIEQIRLLVEQEGYRPRTNNKYGRLTVQLLADGEIVPVGRVRSASRKTRHPVGVYKRAA